jgi:hypothetical protein
MDTDFYIYGGFDVTVNAFTRIALIFNDGQYVVMFFIAVMFGIFFGGAIAFGQGLLGKGGDGAAIINFLVLVLVGVAVFKGLIVPKGTVHIYDPVVNRYQAVGGVPDLIVFATRLTNTAERVLTEVMDNGSAHPRSLQGGGLELLINSYRGDPLGHEAYLQQSIRRYVSDCLPAAASLASYSFDLQQLKSDTKDIKAELAKLVSPAVFTVVYSSASKVGDVMSCQDAWAVKLEPALNSPALYDEFVEHVCAQSGFEVHDPTEGLMQMNRCKAILDDAQDLVFDASASGDYHKFMQDIVLSKSIVSSLMEAPGTTLTRLASKDITESGFSSQLVSEGWLPAIKAIVFGVVLGLMPILALFIVTPMVFKGVHLMFGLMLWLALWGVTDAVVHGIAMDQVISMTAGIKNMNMSLGALMLMPDQATKGLAILGKAQSMGVILSTFIAGVFFKISGYAFTQLSEKWSQDIDRIGDKAGHDVLDPINRVNAVQQHMDTQAKMSTMGLMGMESFGVANQLMTAAPYNQANSQLSTLRQEGYSGHQALSGAGVFEGASQAGNRVAQDNFAGDHFGGNLRSAGSGFGQINRVMDLEDTKGKAQALQGVHADSTLAQAANKDSYIRGVDRVTSNQLRGELANKAGGNPITGMEKLGRFDEAPLAAKVQHYDDSKDYLNALGTSESRFTGEMHGLEQVAQLSGQSVEQLAEFSGMNQGFAMAGTGKAYGALSADEIIQGYEIRDLSTATDGNVVSQIASDEGYGTTQNYLNEMKQQGHNEELANLINAQRLMETMGWDYKDVALAKNGTGWEMALNGEQMVTQGMFEPVDDRYYDDGGLLNMSMAGDGSVVSVFAKTGSAEQVNDSLEVSKGLTFNEGVGQIGPGSFAYAIENRMSDTAHDYSNLYGAMENPATRESTLAQLAQELDNTMHSNVSLQDVVGHREELSAGIGIPGIASLLGGLEARVAGSIFADGTLVDQDTYSANKLVLGSLYNQSSQDAEDYINEVYRPNAASASSEDIEKTRAGFGAERFASYYTNLRDSMLDIANQELDDNSDHYQDATEPKSQN